MTSVSLSRFYKQHTRLNISDYIIDIRLGQVIQLFRNTDMPIHSICYNTGFNNVSNFNRIFKKKENCTPKEFRINYKK